MKVTFNVTRISDYISSIEAWGGSSTARRRGIYNTPTFEHLVNMVNLGRKFFDPLRRHIGHAIRVNSMYRSRELNKVIGGATRSDHLTGEAIDFSVKGMHVETTNADLFHYIKDNMNYYKLIAEFPSQGQPRWIHVSYMMDDKLNEEKRTIIATKVNGRTKYIPYVGNEYFIKK